MHQPAWTAWLNQWKRFSRICMSVGWTEWETSLCNLSVTGNENKMKINILSCKYLFKIKFGSDIAHMLLDSSLRTGLYVQRKSKNKLVGKPISGKQYKKKLCVWTGVSRRYGTANLPTWKQYNYVQLRLLFCFKT